MKDACPLGDLFCLHPVLPGPAPPPRRAPRPDPPVACPGFGFDRQHHVDKNNIRQKWRLSIGQQPGTKSGHRPRDKPLDDCLSFIDSVYKGFHTTVLPRGRPRRIRPGRKAALVLAPNRPAEHMPGWPGLASVRVIIGFWVLYIKNMICIHKCETAKLWVAGCMMHTTIGHGPQFAESKTRTPAGGQGAAGSAGRSRVELGGTGREERSGAGRGEEARLGRGEGRARRCGAARAR